MPRLSLCLKPPVGAFYAVRLGIRGIRGGFAFPFVRKYGIILGTARSIVNGYATER